MNDFKSILIKTNKILVMTNISKNPKRIHKQSFILNY